LKTRAVLALLSFLGVLIASPADAASGGSTLPFNDALTLIQDNLTGPTANTIIVVIIVAALVTVATGRDDSWVKPLGKAVIVCALLAKAATLPSVLGLGSATATPEAYRLPALLVTLTWLATTAALFFLPSFLREGSAARARAEGR
jgi:type IV secretory pathway VirB2 component (pilin)